MKLSEELRIVADEAALDLEEEYILLRAAAALDAAEEAMDEACQCHGNEGLCFKCRKKVEAAMDLLAANQETQT